MSTHDAAVDGGSTTLRFVKMHGAGNDYVHVDGFTTRLDADVLTPHVRHLADRNFGIGGDGVILLAPPSRAPAGPGDPVCRMVMWNADGSRGAMCGNGVRCLARHAREIGAVDDDAFVVETDSGPRPVELVRSPAGAITGARVGMGTVTVGDARQATVAGRSVTWIPGDAGNPHAVVFVGVDPEDYPVEEVGRAFQELVPGGINVEFVQQLPRTGVLLQRTFERGSGETLACGSGATVAGFAAWRTGRLGGPVANVRLRGGELRILIEDGPTPRVVMEGPATVVYEGAVQLPLPARPASSPAP